MLKSRTMLWITFISLATFLLLAAWLLGRLSVLWLLTGWALAWGAVLLILNWPDSTVKSATLYEAILSWRHAALWLGSVLLALGLVSGVKRLLGQPVSLATVGQELLGFTLAYALAVIFTVTFRYFSRTS